MYRSIVGVRGRSASANARVIEIMAVTIRDVARTAGVSPKTVSRVINEEPRVHPDTRKHVLAAIRDLGFRPNPLARGLATRHTRTLGLIVPDISNTFFAAGIDGCVSMAEQHGYNLFLGSVGGDSRREERHVQALLGQRVSGIVFWLTHLTDAVLVGLMDNAAHRCATVFIDQPALESASTHHAVLVDQHFVGELATQHLLSEGRRAIAYLGLQAGTWVASQRYAGYCDALRSDGVEPVDRWTRRGVKASIREGMIGASTLLAQRPRLDAIVAYNDMLAVGALQACKHAGLRVPDDVAIVGVDDTDLAVVADPPLTSIRLYQFETGQHAMALLLSTLEGTAQSGGDSHGSGAIATAGPHRPALKQCARGTLAVPRGDRLLGLKWSRCMIVKRF